MKPALRNYGQLSFQPVLHILYTAFSIDVRRKLKNHFLKPLLRFCFIQMLTLSLLSGQHIQEFTSGDFPENSKTTSLKNTLYRLDKNEKIQDFLDLNKKNNTLPSTPRIMLDSFIYAYNLPGLENKKIRVRKSSFVYDAGGRISVATDYSINDMLGLNSPVEQISYEYNPDFLLAGKTYSKTVNQSWLPDSQITIAYDQLRISELTEFKILNKSENFIPVNKTSIEYHDSDQIKTLLASIYDTINKQWVPSYMKESEFDDSDVLLSEHFFEWDETAEKWMELFQILHFYNDLKQLISSIYYAWDDAGQGWYPVEKYEYLYDNDGNHSIDKSFVWNEDIHDWEAQIMIRHIFDNSGMLSYRMNYEYDKSLIEYVGTTRKDYQYDTDYTFDKLCLPESYNSFYFHHKLETTLESFWKESNETWSTLLKGFYYYSPLQTVSVEQAWDFSVSFFPNPVQNRMTICLTEQVFPMIFELYDPAGRKIMTRSILRSEILDLSFLTTGSYFFILYDQNKHHNGKFIKE